jgi:hypothetical protein
MSFLATQAVTAQAQKAVRGDTTLKDFEQIQETVRASRHED